MAENTKNLAKERAYKNAQSHSRRVRWVKRLLPVFATGIVCVVVATIYISRPNSSFGIDLPNTTLSDGKLVMANPNLDGFTNEDRPYRVSAKRAIQDLAVQDALELEELSAVVELEDGQSARLTSSIGRFVSNANTLNLPSETILTTSDGLRATLGQADINIKTGSVEARNSIKIDNSESVITAESMQIENGGKRIFFEENVRLVLQPKSNDIGAEETETSRTANEVTDSGIN